MTSAAIPAPGPWRATARATGWRAHGIALGVAIATLIALFRHDAAAMARTWWSASTYEHCLFVLPVIAWLIWLRRAALATIAPRGWAAPLLWVAAGVLGWLVGQAAGVAGARQLGLVMMLQGAVAVLLGRAAATILLFPLGYAMFLVPAGDALMPPLQSITARMCMVLLRLFHVPATLDGVFITTPGGWFKVAEACSGAKFLVAMIALGALVAHLGFRRWPRRLGFMALCVVVPVLANGVRAFATILVAQYRGADAASGFDHVVYGWFFFAAVIALVLAAAWPFFDRAADAAPDAALIARAAARQRAVLALPAALGAVLAVAAAAPLWARLATAGAPPVPASAALRDPPGWRRVAATDAVPWHPRFDGADRLIEARYRDAAGGTVDVAVALYAAQGDGRELVGYGRGAVDPRGPWSWAANLPAPPGWAAERIVAPGARPRAVRLSYDVGGVVTASAARVKLATLRRHLLGGDPRAAALLVSAPDDAAGGAALDRFLVALGPPGAAIDRIAGGR